MCPLNLLSSVFVGGVLMRTLLLLCIVVALALTCVVMPVMAQDWGVPDSAYFLEPEYQPDGCSQNLKRLIPLRVFSDDWAQIVHFEFTWTGSNRLDTILFYPSGPDSEFTVFFDINESDKHCYAGIGAGLSGCLTPFDGILAKLVFECEMNDSLSMTFGGNMVGNPTGFEFLSMINGWAPTYQELDTQFVAPDTIMVIPGDVDASSSVDIDDVVYLINYIFAGGCPPWDLNSGDTDQSCGIDIDDVVYLIEFIFGNGPAPLPGCVR